jgi:beta-lactamase class D
MPTMRPLRGCSMCAASTGTIVISSLDGKTAYVHNDARAAERFLPASTFKIPNTLIALEEGAVRDEGEIIKWDGKDKGRPEWNKDQSLATAFPASCVWFYQELAKRVGDGTYRRYLSRMKYGNSRTGPDVTTFWLNGDLRISAREQIAFLKKLVREDLPFKKAHLQTLKKIMTVEETPAYTLRAKTGWTGANGIGWYVGYVETKGTTWLFAMNLDTVTPESMKYRQEITREALKLKGLL